MELSYRCRGSDSYGASFISANESKQVLTREKYEYMKFQNSECSKRREFRMNFIHGFYLIHLPHQTGIPRIEGKLQ